MMIMMMIIILERKKRERDDEEDWERRARDPRDSEVEMTDKARRAFSDARASVGSIASKVKDNMGGGRKIRRPEDDETTPIAGQDKTEQLGEQIRQVKAVMIDNIDIATTRGEKLIEVEGKAEILNTHAHDFVTKSKKLKRKMWWKNIKMMIAIVIFVAAIIYVILALACSGLDLPNCR